MSTVNNFGRGLLTKVRNGRLGVTFTILAAVSIGILAGSVLTSNVSGKEAQQSSSTDARPLTIPNPVTLSNGFSQIVKQVGPAVVNINTVSIPKPTPGGHQGQGDSDLQDRLRRFFGQQGQGDDDGSGSPFDGQGSGKREALGSGFIVDPRGYIITNNHVIDKADHIYVRLSTDPEAGPGDLGRPAKVIGVDRDTDIAVIKIDTTEPLPTIKLGNSDGAEVGDWVLAIGSPFGLSQTVSAGIVSAKNRTIDEPAVNGVATNQIQRFIQTDAAINPGNSGGPLVDMTGSVIGMNTAIYTSAAGSEGVGFAMPSNVLANVYNMLISPDHKVTRGSIGITFQAVEASAVGRVYGFSSGGVLITTVSPNGGAGKAGLQPGDAIVSVDGRHIKDGDDLVADISTRRVGSTVKIGFLRNGKEMSAIVAIGDRAKAAEDLGDHSPENTPPPPAPDAGQSKLGITVAPVPAAAIAKLNLKSGGVIVTDVRSGSFADDIELAKGDVIVEINRHPVTDEASYRAIVSTLKSGDDVVFVTRSARNPGNGNTYIGGTLQ